MSFDLDEGFGNFLNCTIEEKSPFETESAISPAISEPMLKYNPFAEIKTLDDPSREIKINSNISYRFLL